MNNILQGDYSLSGILNIQEMVHYIYLGDDSDSNGI